MKCTLWCSWSDSELSARRNNVSQFVSKASTASLLGLPSGHHARFFEWASHAIVIQEIWRSYEPLLKSINDVPVVSGRSRANYLQRNAAMDTSIRRFWGVIGLANVKPQMRTRPRSLNPSCSTGALPRNHRMRPCSLSFKFSPIVLSLSHTHSLSHFFYVPLHLTL